LDRGITLAPDDAYELHALIDMQADRLTRLVNSLLDMSRIESGALEVRRYPQALGELVEDAITELRSSLGDRQVDVAVPGDLPPADVDHVLVTQVLTNLLDNANRFGPPGTAIAVDVVQAGPDRARVSVTDHGRGVPPGERESVFQKFVRYDSGGRSGLGLAIAKAFVEAHGERIWVEQGRDGGARFVFTVPLATVGDGGE
jgi:two-component system sensor histidine kinase KdpD